MLEEEEAVDYTSIVFKGKTNPTSKAQPKEETIYDEVKVQSEKSKPTAATCGILPDREADNLSGHNLRLLFYIVLLFIVLLMAAVAVSVYFAVSSPRSILVTSLVAENRNLTNLNEKLSADNENLRRDHNNLTVQFDNLTQANAALENKIRHLSEDNQNLTTQNQELETQNNSLVKQIQNIRTKWKKLNVSRAQWSIDAYCPIEKYARTCKACEKSWLEHESNCFIFKENNLPKLTTWIKARADCMESNSDLAVIHNEDEKNFVSGNSKSSGRNQGYWIGLRVEDGRWKWVDGTNLTDDSWIPPPTSGHCAISVRNSGWKSVRCGDRNRWICKKAGLSI